MVTFFIDAGRNKDKKGEIYEKFIKKVLFFYNTSLQERGLVTCWGENGDMQT